MPAFLPQDRAAVLHKKDSTGHCLALHRKRLLTPHLKHEKFLTGNSLEVRWWGLSGLTAGPGVNPWSQKSHGAGCPSPPSKKEKFTINQFWSTSNFLKPPNSTIRAWLSAFRCTHTHSHLAEKRYRQSQPHQRSTEKAGRMKVTTLSEIITFLFSWKDRTAWRTPSSCKSQKMTDESAVPSSCNPDTIRKSSSLIQL